MEDTWHSCGTYGFLVLHGTRHLTHQACAYVKEGNGWQAIGLQRQGITFFLIQLYLRTGETLQSPLNADILSQLLHFLEQLHAPFIVGGDWQKEPDALAATVIQSKFKAQILSTSGPTTLQGSAIDYVLASQSIAGHLTVRADWDAPWKPHCGICVEFNCEQTAVAVQQLQRFPPIGRTFQLPGNWSFWEDDGPFHIMGHLTGLGSDLDTKHLWLIKGGPLPGGKGI